MSVTCAFARLRVCAATRPPKPPPRITSRCLYAIATPFLKRRRPRTAGLARRCCYHSCGISMVPNDSRRNEQIARDALRLLCSNLLQPATRLELLGLLDQELFANPLHRVVFEELGALGTVPARRL